MRMRAQAQRFMVRRPQAPASRSYAQTMRPAGHRHTYFTHIYPALQTVVRLTERRLGSLLFSERSAPSDATRDV
jgi:hypothetical protein